MKRTFTICCTLIALLSRAGAQLEIPGSPILVAPQPDASLLLPVVNTTVGQSGLVTLSWKPVNGAASYHLQLAADPTFTTIVLDSTALTSTTADAVPLLIGTSYYWRVAAENAAGTGDWSMPQRFISSASGAGENDRSLKQADLVTFNEISVPFVRTYLGNAAWGDFDNDGDLDVAVVGDSDGGNGPSARIYRNDGGTFTDIQVALPVVSRGMANWGDYDHDGDLDLLLEGTFPNGVEKQISICRNDGGSFVVVANITTGWFGDLAWADYDNDDDLDVVTSGVIYDGPGGTGRETAAIYRNDNGTFVDINANLTGLSECSLTWTDIDNDGDLDLHMTGMPQLWDHPVSLTYRNDHGTFVEIPNTISGFWMTSAAWADYDNDGDVDLLVFGQYGSNGQGLVATRIYRNDGGIFVDINASLPPLEDGDISWGDYDNDGDLDFVIEGWGSQQFTRIYRNDGGVFTAVSTSIVDVFAGSLQWGDYDNDGDLDILLTGSTIGSILPTTRLYRNMAGSNTFSMNTVPSPPGNLTASGAANQAVLAWSPGSDSQTPQGALHYNLRIGTSPGGSQIVGPMADASTGYRRLAALGNANEDTMWTIKNLPNGQYYWSVQTIDGAYAGSPFAPEQGLFVGTEVSGQKFNDLNGNGVKDIGEPGLQGWAIHLTVDIASPPVPVTTTTDANGEYRFTNISPNNYRVSEDNQPGWTQTLPGGDGTYHVSLAGGQQITGRDFGNHNSSASLTIGVHMRVGWNIVSLPLVVADQSPGAVFNSPHRLSNLFRWIGSYVPTDTLRYGVGYLVKWSADEIFSITGTELDNTNTALLLGWNLLGSLTYPLPTSNVNATGGALISDFWDVASRRYRVASAISPGTGAWVYSDGSGTIDAAYNSCFGLLPPEFAEPPSPECESDILATAGSTLQFPIVVHDLNGGLTTLSVSGVPAGATLAPSLPLTGSIDSTVFIWTPALSDTGVHLVKFTATNACGIVSTCSYAIIVQSQSEFAIRLTVEDSSIQQRVYFGVSKEATDCIDSAVGEKQRPPVLPYNDVRLTNVSGRTCLGNGTISDLRSYISTAQVDTYRVTLPTEFLDGSFLSWPDLTNYYDGPVQLTDGLTTIDMKSQTSYIATAGASAVRIIATGPHYRPPPAAVNTLSPTQPRQDSAMFNATIDAHGVSPTTAWFEWGTTPSYGDSTPQRSIAVNAPVHFSEGISGLSPNTTYHYRAVARNIQGTSPGQDTMFTTAPVTGFADISAPLMNLAGEVAWADYDNDGDLDLLVSGIGVQDTTRRTKIYRNDNGTFVDINAPLPNVSSPSVAAWGDEDNDGDLDLFIAGTLGPNNFNPVAKIFRNDNGAFVDIGAPITAGIGASAWGDYDNDGDLDLLVAGSPDNGSTFFTKLYRNDNGTFVDAGVSLPGVWGASLAWGDFDNDGDLDILLTGYGTFSVTTRVFRNDGGGVFTDINAPLTRVNSGRAVWGDYDNDGDLDILVTGLQIGLGTPFTTIYRNDNGSFVDIHPSLAQLGNSIGAWGDYDNDGDLDIALSGFDGVNFVTKVYRNDNGVFADINASIPGAFYSSVAWGDYNNDGYMDLALSGFTSASNPHTPVARVFRNLLGSNSFSVNTKPTAPTGLVSTAGGNSVVMTWNKSADAQTSQNGLTYNIRLGTTTNGIQTVTPMASLSNGYRRVAEIGNTNHRNSRTIKNLSGGTYYWSVQAIDNAFAGSSFAAEGSFVIAAQSPIVTTLAADNIAQSSAELHATVNPNGSSTSAHFEWGQNTSYGNTTPTVALGSGTGVVSFTQSLSGLIANTAYHFRVVAQNGNGASTGLDQSFSTSAASGPALDIPLTVRDNGPDMLPTIKSGARNISASTAVEFGADPAATYCRDAAFGELTLPPLPPPGVFDVRFLDPRGSTPACFDLGMNKDFRQFTSASQVDTYLVRFQPGPDGYPITISWPSLVSHYGGPMTLTNFNGSMPVSVNMLTSTSVQVTDSTTTTIQIIAHGPSVIPIPPAAFRTFAQGDYAVRSAWMRFYPPTPGNVLDTVFVRMGWKRTGFFLGIPAPIHSRTNAWVLFKNYSAYLRRFLPQTGPARGFDTYGGAAWHGWRVAPIASLHNNVLAGEQFSLKFNIAASDLGITPAGLGDLIYNDASNPASPCNGKTVRQIVAKVDSALTFWQGHAAQYFHELAISLQQINNGFTGPLNVISGSPLRLTGAISLQNVPVLHLSTAPPEEIRTPELLAEETPELLPEQYALRQNYPNPFNPTTIIQFDLPSQAIVTLKIYNMLGQEVAILFDHTTMDIGLQETEFNADFVPSGLYLYRLDAIDQETGTPVFSQTKKMLLVK